MLRRRPRLRGLVPVWIALVACTFRETPTSGGDASRELLRTTWAAYRRAFIQEDGRVIDWKEGGLSTSEGQAYAMLRAVWMEDRVTFDRTLNWGVNNLNGGIRSDRLWAWKWGRAPDGRYRALDPAFASDADQDVALALLMAARAWNEDVYRGRALAQLADLWEKGTRLVKGRRYLLAGDVLCGSSTCRLNPSYCAPYAYRVFAREDPAHAWLSLVDSCYDVLVRNSALTTTHLPSDWILLDVATGELHLGSEKDTQYSYDALRVPWRIALDRILYGEPRAEAYLRHALAWPASHFRKEHRLPGAISGSGQARVTFEALEMLAAMAPALRESAPEVAVEMDRRLRSALVDGRWEDRKSYYLQNWAWFGAALEGRILTPFERVK